MEEPEWTYTGYKSEYNGQGTLNDYVPPVLKKGDKVSYVTNVTAVIHGRTKSIKMYLEGVWDGEKVQFNDDEKTVVRNNWWLKLI
jgi:hypothetical protein